MKTLTLPYLFLIITVGFYSCKSSPSDLAIQWTNDIKQKIIQDASLKSDSTTFDSTHFHLTLYKGNIRLKQFILRPTFDTILKKVVSVDTVVSIFYSSDQNFELVRELCPAISRSFEGIRYKNEFIGLSEYRYCNGQIKERGLGYHGHVGTWTEFDSTGKIIRQTDKGNTNQLLELQKIKYYR